MSASAERVRRSSVRDIEPARVGHQPDNAERGYRYSDSARARGAKKGEKRGSALFVGAPPRAGSERFKCFRPETII